MDEAYQYVIDIMGYKPVNDKGEYSSADIAQVNVILYEIDQANLEILRKYGADV